MSLSWLSGGAMARLLPQGAEDMARPVQHLPPCLAPGRHFTPNTDSTEGLHVWVEDLLLPLFQKPPADVLPSFITSRATLSKCPPQKEFQSFSVSAVPFWQLAR